MRGDIIHDQRGWFYRDNGNHTADVLSAEGGASPTTAQKLPVTSITAPVVLVRNDAPTGNGDKLAARVAVVLARRYA
jgi:hypothetical protein